MRNKQHQKNENANNQKALDTQLEEPFFTRLSTFSNRMDLRYPLHHSCSFGKPKTQKRKKKKKLRRKRKIKRMYTYHVSINYQQLLVTDKQMIYQRMRSKGIENQVQKYYLNKFGSKKHHKKLKPKYKNPNKKKNKLVKLVKPKTKTTLYKLQPKENNLDFSNKNKQIQDKIYDQIQTKIELIKKLVRNNEDIKIEFEAINTLNDISDLIDSVIKQDESN
ncbi:hypothetical protein M0813_27684 [Anaeramoeba flamelloides]|uniref:Uncharacterized protein n=1 Tax=Anaeramoeba flamelloides TaxID=1746091 RepID=A0ABQ8XZS2_9EUKA|nr:hypothetical protein M0813_27684 [Anaeramoeba flamelloides]